MPFVFIHKKLISFVGWDTSANVSSGIDGIFTSQLCRKRLGTSECIHYNDAIMGAMASQITSPTIVYSTVYSGGDQRKHQSSASLALVRGIHRGPGTSPPEWPVTRKMFPFEDVIMFLFHLNKNTCYVTMNTRLSVLFGFDCNQNMLQLHKNRSKFFINTTCSCLIICI